MSTNISDHFVHLTPPGSLQLTSQQFRDLGFKVLPGGTHTDGLTENALVVFSDGVYFELISFVKPVEAYPPGSPEREARETHKWAQKSPGWIDYAFLGNGSKVVGDRISDIINRRAKEDGSDDLYRAETDGGRTRPDGVVLQWLITNPPEEDVGILPFFCGDVTDRSLRVPTDPASNTQHDNTATGINHIQVVARSAEPEALVDDFTYTIGHSPKQISTSSYEWELKTHTGTARLIVDVETVKVKRTTVTIRELGIRVTKTPGSDSSNTPYGRIAWVKA